MTKFVISLIGLFILNAVACKFIAVQPLNIQPQAQKIAAFVELKDNINQVQVAYISRTRNLNSGTKWDFDDGDTIFSSPDTVILNTVQNYRFDTIKGAKVNLYRNEKLIKKQFIQDRFIKTFYTTDSVEMQANDIFKLEITAPDYETATTTQIVPRTVPLKSAKFSRNSFNSPKYGKLSEIILEFDDPPKETNFYTFQVTALTNNINYQPNSRPDGRFFPKVIALDADSKTPNFLRDSNFDGKKYFWHIGIFDEVGNNFENYINFFIEFRSTSKDYEKYQLAIDAGLKSFENPFAEPITPFSNLNNGVGLFVISGKPDTLTISAK